MVLLPLTRTLRLVRYWMVIMLIISIPGGSATLIALATTKSRLPIPGTWARRLRRLLQIISTSPPRVLLVCGLEHIFHWAIFVTIPLITLSFLKGSENYLEFLSHLPGVLYDGFINIVASVRVIVPWSLENSPFSKSPIQ